MSNNQYNFDIKIPKELIAKENHDKVFEGVLENKIIIGLCGYSKSGKDTIAKTFIKNYGFHRVAFADNVKKDMNKHFKKIVYDYLTNISTAHPDVAVAFLFEDMRTITMDMIDFQTEDIYIKKILRPFIIWYAQKMRELNGPYYWINQAFKLDASGYDKIIISDIRRTPELDIFENSITFIEKSMSMFALAGCHESCPRTTRHLHSTVLIHVNQFELNDTDKLTHDCIRIAQEKWMFDDVIYIDSRLPEDGNYRNKSIGIQIKKVVKKFGIKPPDKTISIKQVRLFNH
ncbi:MAG: hypothetical protein HRT42_14690 [Campylobacteraceae bacterium]|nr:hypothetical protein [Campylobacteraceae bacterium]